MRLTTETYLTINGEAIIDFLEKLQKKYPDIERLHIVLDRAGYQIGRAHV